MENKLKATTKMWFALLIAAFLVAIGIIIYLLVHPQKTVEMEQTVVSLTPTASAPAPSNIAIPGYPELTLISRQASFPRCLKILRATPAISCWIWFSPIPGRPSGPQKTSNLARVYKTLEPPSFPNPVSIMPSSATRPPVSTTSGL